jgi:hypothetical protein
MGCPSNVTNPITGSSKRRKSSPDSTGSVLTIQLLVIRLLAVTRRSQDFKSCGFRHNKSPTIAPTSGIAVSTTA